VQGYETHSQIAEDVEQRYVKRLKTSRGKAKAIADLGQFITDYLEDQNYLIYTLADAKPSEITAIMKLSEDAFNQLLIADKKRAQAADKMRKQSEKNKKSKGRIR